MSRQRLRTGDLQVLKDSLITEISTAKVTYRDPVIIVGGDFNRRDFAGFFADAKQLLRIDTGPTRDHQVLDVFYDHKCVYVAAKLSGLDMDQMAERFECVVVALNDKHFPLVRVRKRSNKPPWMTRSIRRLFRRKV